MFKQLEEVKKDIIKNLMELEQEYDCDFEIDYILYNSYKDEYIAFVSNNGDYIKKLFMNKENYNLKKQMTDIPEWSYSFDDFFFQYLEDDYQIQYMDNKTHYNLWASLEDEYEELKFKNGVQTYLEYCYENDISPENLVYNAMKLYNKEYFRVEENQVQMSVKSYDKMKEVSYLSFVLGHDLLKDFFEKSKIQECDIVYGFCNELSKRFMDSDYYNKTHFSTYEMLQEWINDNFKDVEYLFEQYSNNKIKNLDNGIYLIDTGFMDEVPVALVEYYKNEIRKFLIVYDYEIKSNVFTYKQAQYYNNDLSEAREKFDSITKKKTLEERER